MSRQHSNVGVDFKRSKILRDSYPWKRSKNSKTIQNNTQPRWWEMCAIFHTKASLMKLIILTQFIWIIHAIIYYTNLRETQASLNHRLSKWVSVWSAWRERQEKCDEIRKRWKLKSGKHVSRSGLSGMLLSPDVYCNLILTREQSLS